MQVLLYFREDQLNSCFRSLPQVVEVQQKLEGKRKDIEKLQEKEKALHATFVTSLGENNKFADYLTKVFKKKIKRAKKKTTEGEGRSCVVWIQPLESIAMNQARYFLICDFSKTLVIIKKSMIF